MNWIGAHLCICKFVSEVSKCKRIAQTVSGFRTVLITELAFEQLKAGAGIRVFSKVEYKRKNLIMVSGIHKLNLKHWLAELVDANIFIWHTYPSQQFSGS